MNIREHLEINAMVPRENNTYPNHFLSVYFVFFILLFITLASAQEDPSQNFVFEKGGQYQFLQKNMACQNWSLVNMDNKVKLGKEKSFHFNDNSPVADTLIYLHFPMLVQPYTQYVLKYSAKIQEIKGPPPYFQINFLDYNRDYLSSLTQELPVDKLSTDWTPREIKFTTSGKTYALNLHIYTTREGTADFWLDNIILEQVSEPQALKPPGITLFQNKSLSLSDLNPPTKNLTVIPLPDSTDNLHTYFNLHWTNFQGKAYLYLDWMTSPLDTTIKYQDYCEIENIQGVTPEWDGMSAQWIRVSPNDPKNLSYQLDKCFNSSPGTGKLSIEHSLIIPQGMKSLRVHIAKDPSSQGQLFLDDLLLTLEKE